MKLIKSSLIVFLVLVLFLNKIHAQEVIGVSPADIRFSQVLRGGYAERPILISLTTDYNVSMSIETRGDVKDWLNFSETEYNVSKNNPWRLIVKVSPPPDVPNGNYSGFIRVSSNSLSASASEGHAVGTVKAVIDVAVVVEIVDKQIIGCQASGFTVNSVEKGDQIPFSVSILNQGNIRLKPKMIVNIWDKDQVNIVKTYDYSNETIMPTLSKTINFKVDSRDLPISQYWVDFEASDCGDSQTLTFDVLDIGALRADGILTNIISQTWTDIDQTVPIIANFKNTGEKDVNAQFKGQVSKDNKIFEVLQSEMQSVSMGDTNNFTFYFTPKESGRFIVSGRVYYDNKRTFESSTVINVRPKVITLQGILIYFIYFVILVFIFFLFYKIRKERIGYMQKIRRLKRL